MNCDEEENYTQDAIFKPLRDKKSLPSCMQVCPSVRTHTDTCMLLDMHAADARARSFY